MLDIRKNIMGKGKEKETRHGFWPEGLLLRAKTHRCVCKKWWQRHFREKKQHGQSFWDWKSPVSFSVFSEHKINRWGAASEAGNRIAKAFLCYRLYETPKGKKKK